MADTTASLGLDRWSGLGRLAADGEGPREAAGGAVGIADLDPSGVRTARQRATGADGPLAWRAAIDLRARVGAVNL